MAYRLTGLLGTLPPLVYPTKSVYYAASASQGQARLPLSRSCYGNYSARIRILLIVWRRLRSENCSPFLSPGAPDSSGVFDAFSAEKDDQSEVG
jgi:hypothetical protein